MANKNKISLIKTGHQHGYVDGQHMFTCTFAVKMIDRLNSPMQFNCQFTKWMKREMHVYVTDPHFPPNLNSILKISYQQNHNRMHKDLLLKKKRNH